jgi:hypothetical protein
MKTNRAHRYTVELRIFGAMDMDPDGVTAETGLKPCDVRRAEIDQDGKLRHKSRWAYNGGGESGAYDWDTLEEGLEFVLERASGSVDLFKKYAAKHLVIWWCGHFQSSFDGGPTLSPRLLERLGEFGAAVFIDNYSTYKGLSPVGSTLRSEIDAGRSGGVDSLNKATDKS